MNLLVAFAVSLKHKLRFEPYTYYDDIAELVEHIDTFARSATKENTVRPKSGMFKAVGENLGLSFAASNPRKMMKKNQSPLGNLPLEVLCYLTAYVDELALNGQLPIGMQQTAACKLSRSKASMRYLKLLTVLFRQWPSGVERRFSQYGTCCQHTSSYCLRDCHLADHLALRVPPPLPTAPRARLDHDPGYRSCILYHPRDLLHRTRNREPLR